MRIGISIVTRGLIGRTSTRGLATRGYFDITDAPYPLPPSTGFVEVPMPMSLPPSGIRLDKVLQRLDEKELEEFYKVLNILKAFLICQN
jgi:hypothetical protein